MPWNPGMVVQAAAGGRKVGGEEGVALARKRLPE